MEFLSVTLALVYLETIAGGIGFQLFMSAGYFFDIREIGFITYLILAVAILMEIVATQLKKRYHIQY